MERWDRENQKCAQKKKMDRGGKTKVGAKALEKRGKKTVEKIGELNEKESESKDW